MLTRLGRRRRCWRTGSSPTGRSRVPRADPDRDGDPDPRAGPLSGRLSAVRVPACRRLAPPEQGARGLGTAGPQAAVGDGPGELGPPQPERPDSGNGYRARSLMAGALILPGGRDSEQAHRVSSGVTGIGESSDAFRCGVWREGTGRPWQRHSEQECPSVKGAPRTGWSPGPSAPGAGGPPSRGARRATVRVLQAGVDRGLLGSGDLIGAAARPGRHVGAPGCAGPAWATA